MLVSERKSDGAAHNSFGGVADAVLLSKLGREADSHNRFVLAFEIGERRKLAVRFSFGRWRPCNPFRCVLNSDIPNVGDEGYLVTSALALEAIESLAFGDDERTLAAFALGALSAPLRTVGCEL